MATRKGAFDKGPRLPIGDIPEVQEYTDLKQEVDALKAEHPEVFIQYADLVDRMNAAMEKADLAVRARGVSCGAFENFSVTVKYDPNKLYDEVGEEMFLACGGTIAQVSTYSIDPKQVEAAIATKKIPEECVENFRTVSRSYHAPKKISV